jgi:spore coat-associated protein N
MKNIVISLGIIGLVAVAVISGTVAYFSDTETASVSIQTGTVDIDVDGNNPWTGNYHMSNLAPGETREINFVIHNTGTNPINVWKILANLTTDTGAQSEPECEAEKGTWDNTTKICTAMTAEDNEIDKAIEYSLRVELYRANDTKIWDQIVYNGDYTVSQIKDLDMILGMIPAGDYMKVFQKYKFKTTFGNLHQGDRMNFDIKVVVQQLTGTLVLENKNTSNWSILHDNTYAVLNYTLRAPELGYNLLGSGLISDKKYALVYHPETGSDCRLIAEGQSDSSGNLGISGIKELDTDLPANTEGLYPDGAKIWLVPDGSYDTTTGCVNWANMGNYLWDTALIQYENIDEGITTVPDNPVVPEAPDDSILATSESIILDELGEDIDSQYGYQYVGYSTANVTFTYDSPADDKLIGTITATGLKPYATYQVKFTGKPTCAVSGGNDVANEYIGYNGRWTCVGGSTCTGTPSDKNRSDAQYIANKAKLDGDPEKECIAGYLVWDFFTVDGSGNSTKTIQTASSYHVLFSNGGVCGSTDNSHLITPDIAHPTVKFSAAVDVGGEIERGTCGGLTLNAGTYDLKMSLTEESFHQGNWATVLMKDISFVIQ